jgi:hypothetical protein
MPSLPLKLYALQQFELAIDRARARLDEIEQALAKDETVTACQTRYDSCVMALSQAQAQVKDLELENAGLSEKITEVDTLLYSGKLKNPKELTERQNELDSLQRRKAGLEERLLIARQELEQARADLKTAEVNLQTAIQERDQRHIDLIAESDKLNKRIKKNLKERKQKLAEISEADYTLYRNLRKRHKGQAVAVLVDDMICSVCRVGQTTTSVDEIKDNHTLIYCGNCGRILVYIP